MTMNTSAASLHVWARCMALTGICCPKETFADFRNAAAIAGWRAKVFCQIFVNRGGLEPLLTAEAGHEAVRAVKLDDLLLGNAGDAVQTVDILGDEAEKLTALVEIPD